MSSTQVATHTDASEAAPVAHSSELLRFVKFCVVGSSNFVLDAAVTHVLSFNFHLHAWLALSIAFVVAVSNSFYWNRRWTFSDTKKGNEQQLYILFVLINLVGLAIDWVLYYSVVIAVSGSMHNVDTPPTKIWILAKVSATSVIVFWNFFANRRWTFKA